MLDVYELIETKTKEERQEHLDLSSECIFRGGNSTNHKGVLAQYLNTNMPMNVGKDLNSTKILLCHACHNGNCSNPVHLYWGTYAENSQDATESGVCRKRKKDPKEYTYRHSAETKEKMSEAKKGKPSNNPTGIGLSRGWNTGKKYSLTHKYMWITNGEVNTRILLDTDIPTGWYRGKIQKPKNKF